MGGQARLKNTVEGDSSMSQVSIASFFAKKDDSSPKPDPKPPTPETPKQVEVATAAATEEASKEAAKAPKVDDEQEFIDFFLSKAGSPLIRGTPLKTRRIAVFGEKYYWGGSVTFPLNALPLSFRKWCAAHNYTRFNSVLVNVYEEKTSNISWHMDATDSLRKAEVVSISFAARRKDRKKTLANFEFRWPDKKNPTKKKTSTISLEHGTVIRFDAIKHKRKKCEHRVAKTLHPRVNVTLRLIKKPK